MVIKTRPDSEDEIAGYGDILIAISNEEMELMACMLGMLKLGNRPYQEAAARLIDTFEQITGDSDYTSTCLSLVQPVLEVYDEDYDIVATYNDDNIFEFIV